MSYRYQSTVRSQAQRDLRDIHYTVKLLITRLERDSSAQSQHAATLLAAVRYKLACLEFTLTH